MPPVVAAPTFAIRKLAVAVFTLDDHMPATNPWARSGVPLASGRRQGTLRRGRSRALATLLFAGLPGRVPRSVREDKPVEEVGRGARGQRHMERRDIDELRQKVLCAAVLENSGWAIDRRESTRHAVKYRRGDDIIIVIHGGRGWFDPLSDAKGDVFSLAQHLGEMDFRAACAHVADLVGFVPRAPVWTRPSRTKPLLPLVQRWANRLAPNPDSATWRYLHDERCLPEAILRAAIRQGLLRAGPHGSMWAAYTNDDDVLVGWEERGPRWRGFASGGAKVLFRFGAASPDRACVTEGAIDAMSLAALECSGENLRDGSLYVATGGG